MVTNNEGQLISEFLDLDHTYSEDDVHIKFGLPQRTLSGFWGDVFVLEDGTEIIVYQGIGKPEPLRENLSGWWSRRIDETNRIVYYEQGEIVYIISCLGHYDD